MQIHWRHPGELEDALRTKSEGRIRDLAEGHSDLIDAWIDVEPSSGHHRLGDEHVTIHATVRGGQVVARASDAHLEIALGQALDKFSRNVWNLREKRSDRRQARSVRA